MPSWQEKNAVIGACARGMLQYGDVIERPVGTARGPSFTETGSDELAALPDVAKLVHLDI